MPDLSVIIQYKIYWPNDCCLFKQHVSSSSSIYNDSMDSLSSFLPSIPIGGIVKYSWVLRVSSHSILALKSCLISVLSSNIKFIGQMIVVYLRHFQFSIKRVQVKSMIRVTWTFLDFIIPKPSYGQFTKTLLIPQWLHKKKKKKKKKNFFF